MLMNLAAVRGVKGHRTKGSILVLAAMFLIVVLAFTALTIDIGFLALTKTQLQAAADSAALAGAMELSGTEDPAVVRQNATAAALDVASRFENGNQSAVTLTPNSDISFGRMNVLNGRTTFQWGNQYSPYNVIKVRAHRSSVVDSNGVTNNNQLPLFFAPVLGTKTAAVGAEAIATFQPRDIMVALDFSSSMNDDSCLSRIGALGRVQIESNLRRMWQELGSPIYGNMAFTPAYVTFSGVPRSGTIPHIDVTYRRRQVDVVSTSSLIQVRLKFTNGSFQTITVPGTAKTWTGGGTGSNANKDIASVWVKSGSNASMPTGGHGELFDFTATNIATALGLTAYPYARGSWTEYIEEVQEPDNGIADAGYRDMYGYLTWLEYLQTVRPYSSDTADLWKTSEQPVGSMKDAVELFINHLIAVEAEDRVGLSIYSHQNTAGAILEHGLIDDIQQIATTTRHRQAGHYTGGTNIYAGMKEARQELIANARPRAFRMMVLMTDGLPNAPGNAAQARRKVIDEAYLAKNNSIKILTISLGSGADTSLMEEVAQITGGVHFVVPGGRSFDAVRSQLQVVFQEIASSRPLKLIGGGS